MDLFKLLGTIAIDNNEANKKIDETTKKAQETSAKLSSVGEKFTNTGESLTKAGKKMMPITLAVAGLGTASVTVASDFEKSMSQVAATMGMTSEEINNGSEDFEKLSKAARDMGKATKFSASESAEALNYLALAGKSVDESVTLLPKILNLASAGGIDLAYASDMVTDSMSALSLETKDADSFIDKMAKTSQKSNTSVAQLGEAILTVGGTAKNMSGGVTELNTCLGILADNGIKGAEGGTALRNMILSLSAPIDKASLMMEDLGLKVYDNTGKMKPLNEVFKDLNDIMKDMTEEEKIDVLNTIFNKVDLKSAQAMLSNCGDRFDELSSMIEKADGSAQNMADTMENNLTGQITKLKSALSEAGIQIGQKFAPYIKKAVDVINQLTDKFNALSPSQQDVIIKIGLIVGAIAPLLLIAGKLSTGIGAVSNAFSKMIPKIVDVSNKIRSATGIANTSFLGVAAIVGVLVLAFKHLWDTNEDFRNAITQIWEGIKNTFGGFINGIQERLSGLQQAFTNIIEFLKPLWEGFCNFVAPIFVTAFQLIGDTFKAITDTIMGILDIFIGIFTGDWGKLWDGVKGVFTGIWEAICGAFRPIVDVIKIIFTPILDFFKGVWNGIKNIFGGVADWFKNIFTKAWQGVKDVFSVGGKIFAGITEGIVNFFKTIVNGIIGGINNVIAIPFNAINGILDRIRSINILGLKPFEWVHTFNVPQIPELEQGGILEKGQVGLLEGNGAEAVVPLEKNKAWIHSVAEDIKNEFGGMNNTEVLNKLDEVIDTFKSLKIYLNGDVMVGQLAPAMDTALGNIYDAKGRGGRSTW